PEFLERFYQLFVSSSPEVKEKFKRTNFHRQRRMLKSSLYMMVFAAEGKPEGFVHMERIAKQHGKQDLDVKPEMYDLWMNSLIQAVKEFDRGFNADTEQAWKHMLGQGIEFMKTHG